MLERLIITLVLAAGFVLICWTIMEYWLRTSKHTKEIGLRAKIIYVVGSFCQTLSQKKDFHRMELKEDFGKAHLHGLNTEEMDTGSANRSEGREQDVYRKERKYKMKVNM